MVSKDFINNMKQALLTKVKHVVQIKVKPFFWMGVKLFCSDRVNVISNRNFYRLLR